MRRTHCQITYIKHTITNLNAPSYHLTVQRLTVQFMVCMRIDLTCDQFVRISAFANLLALLLFDFAKKGEKTFGRESVNANQDNNDSTKNEKLTGNVQSVQFIYEKL